MKKIISLLLMACVLLCSMSVSAKSEYQCHLEWIVEPTEDLSNVTSIINENLYCFEGDNGGFGIVDKDGEVIYPAISDLWWYDNCFMATVTNEYNGWGIYDYSGNVIIPPIYPYRSFDVYDNYIITYREKTEEEIQKLFEESGGISQSQRVSGHGAYDYNGNIIIPFEYEKLFPYASSELLVAKKDGKYGIIDTLCKTILPFEYEELLPYASSELLIAKKDGKYGIIDTLCNTILPFEYEKLLPSDSSELLIAKKNGKYGILDTLCNTILPFEYDYIDRMYFDDDYFIATKGDKGALVYKDKLISDFEDLNDVYSLEPRSSSNIEYNPDPITYIGEGIIVDKYSNPLLSESYTCINVTDNLVLVETPDGKKGVLKVVTNEITMGINNYNVNVFGKTVKIDSYPIIINNRTMLPIRFVAEALGATIGWDSSTQSVTITKDSTEIILQIGNNVAVKNGTEITLDTAPFIKNGRTYLPVRFVSEQLGADVEWIPEPQSVVIRK